MTTSVRRHQHPDAGTTHLPDLESWTVHAGPDREEVGSVEEVLLDQQGLPRYLEVDLSASDRTVLVPAGYAYRDAEDEVVWIPALEGGRLEDVPEWESGSSINPEYEREVARAWDGLDRGRGFYDSPHFHDRNFRSSRTSGRDGDTTKAAAFRVDTLDDYQVAEGDPDPRGWSIVDRNSNTFGKVDHLLGDTETMKVRYFVIELDELDGQHDKILVPAGHVHLDVDEEQASVPVLEQSTIPGYPRWTGKSVDRDHERDVAEYLDESYDTDETRHQHPRYTSDHLVHS